MNRALFFLPIRQSSLEKLEHANGPSCLKSAAHKRALVWRDIGTSCTMKMPVQESGSLEAKENSWHVPQALTRFLRLRRETL